MRIAVVVATEIFGAILIVGRVGIGEIHHQSFYRRSKSRNDRAFPRFSHFVQNFGLDLQVPGKMHLACLEHSPGCRRCIATALKKDALECGLAFHAIMLIGFEHDHIVRFEVDDLEGACTDGIEVLLGAFLRFGTYTALKLRRLHDRGVVADEWGIRKRFGYREIDPDGVRVQRVHRHDVVEVVG